MARRNSGGNVIGRVFLWFAAGFLIIGTVAGIKFVLENDVISSSELPPVSSEEPPVSSEEPPVSSEEPPVSSEEPPVSSEEPPIDYLEMLPIKGQFHSLYYSDSDINFSVEENISPLIQTSYRNSETHGQLNYKGRSYSFNSLRMGKAYEAQSLGIQLGFPTAVTDIHYYDFGLPQLSKKYTSYLMFDYKVFNEADFHIAYDNFMIFRREDVLPFANADLHLIYRTNKSPDWHYIQGDINGNATISADGLFYQFALVFNTNNKANNLTVQYIDLKSGYLELDPQPQGLFRIEVGGSNFYITSNDFETNAGIIVEEQYITAEYEYGYSIKQKNNKYVIDFRIAPDYTQGGIALVFTSTSTNYQDPYIIESLFDLQEGVTTLTRTDVWTVTNRPFYEYDF